MVNTAKKYKLWVSATVSVKQAFSGGPGEEVFHKKKKKFLASPIPYLYYRWLLPTDLIPWAQHLPIYLYFKYSLQRKFKEPPSTHGLMSLLSILYQLIYSYSIQFLPPLVGVGCFIFPIIVYLYPPAFLDLSAYLSFASLINIIIHLLFEGKSYFMHWSVLIG